MCLHKLWTCDQQLHLTDADKAARQEDVRPAPYRRRRTAPERVAVFGLSVSRAVLERTLPDLEASVHRLEASTDSYGAA